MAGSATRLSASGQNGFIATSQTWPVRVGPIAGIAAPEHLFRGFQRASPPARRRRQRRRPPRPRWRSSAPASWRRCPGRRRAALIGGQIGQAEQARAGRASGRRRRRRCHVPASRAGRRTREAARSATPRVIRVTRCGVMRIPDWPPSSVTASLRPFAQTVKQLGLGAGHQGLRPSAQISS